MKEMTPEELHAMARELPHNDCPCAGQVGVESPVTQEAETAHMPDQLTDEDKERIKAALNEIRDNYAKAVRGVFPPPVKGARSVRRIAITYEGSCTSYRADADGIWLGTAGEMLFVPHDMIDVFMEELTHVRDEHEDMRNDSHQ